MFPAPPTLNPTGPTTPPHQEEIQRKRKISKPIVKTPVLNKAGKKFIQEVTEVFLFLARSVDRTIPPLLSALASKQAASTEATMEKCLHFLDYAASQEDAILTYKASNMVPTIHSDASYLSKPKACCQAGRHMFMAETEEIPTINGTVLNILEIIRAVMSSTAEAKLSTLFINIKMAVSMCRMLEELGHPQTRTPIQTDNSTAHTLLTNKILPKSLKAMDMQSYWLQCHGTQNQYQYYWRPETQNLADYWTKHHLASHHKPF
jgi:hypothetical protein